MHHSREFLSPSEAARRLGISPKALRLYEKRGMIAPGRTSAGWRTYGPADMARAAEIVALRALGLSLAQVSRVLGGEPDCLEPALAAHQAVLEGEVRRLDDTVGKVRSMREGLMEGRSPAADELARLLSLPGEAPISFDLPWPWGGETFELGHIGPITYITGPLGSGKTRFARKIAEALPDAAFLGLERASDEGLTAAEAQLAEDAALKARVDRAMAWLAEDGAAVSPALTALLVALEADGPAILVVDLIEHGLDRPTQEALIARLRRRGPDAGALFVMTRSTSILDLAAVGPGEAIIICPANHCPPCRVLPYPGTPGYEAVATCLASPEVRARTEGVVAIRA